MNNALAINSAGRAGSAAHDRSKALAAARTHSVRVYWLKRFIVSFSVIAGLALMAIAIFEPFSTMPDNISVAGASLNGTKITMELPRLNGFRKDGRPYQVRARSGVQDVRSPKLIELSDVEARIQLEHSNIVNVIAPKGIFDSGADAMKLFAGPSGENITLKSSTGFFVVLRSADVDLKAGTLRSVEPVDVQMPNGRIHADQIDVIDGGKVITFAGNVRSLFANPGSEPAAGVGEGRN